MDENKIENLAMTIIAFGGDARSLAFDALASAKSGNKAECLEKLHKAQESIKMAHKAQLELLSMEARGESGEVKYLMVHAQDHLMNAMLAVDLIEQMADLFFAKEETA
ncbi:MAG: PTS lactose/cellobiose transporter subunit IIA [Erysipelotrichaceae bacterium]|jgi:PTS system cellobiose-specific IIA component|nr:PTS lactose/cellobiose transporter subunit IIA [Erysipelotrichaceae bacterium]